MQEIFKAVWNFLEKDCKIFLVQHLNAVNLGPKVWVLVRFGVLDTLHDGYAIWIRNLNIWRFGIDWCRPTLSAQFVPWNVLRRVDHVNSTRLSLDLIALHPLSIIGLRSYGAHEILLPSTTQKSCRVNKHNTNRSTQISRQWLLPWVILEDNTIINTSTYEHTNQHIITTPPVRYQTNKTYFPPSCSTYTPCVKFNARSCAQCFDQR
jgi:hypothetical protein